MTPVQVPKVPADPDKIRAAIRRSGQMQSVVARAAGIDKTTLSKQLGGYRPIDLEDLMSLGFALGVPWRTLLLDECDGCGGVHCDRSHEVAA